MILTLQIAYLPTLYAAFNRRETEVTLLNARGGFPSWGPELLARTYYALGSGASTLDTMPALYAQWERWASDVAESHTTYLQLVRFRSPQPLSSWVTSLLSVLDSAALFLALSPTAAPVVPARLCLRSGFLCFYRIARAMGFDIPQEPDPAAGISISYDEFLEAVKRMREVDFPIERDPEQAWPDFVGWRVNYEQAAYCGGRRRLRRAGQVVRSAQAPGGADRAHPPASRPPAQVGKPQGRTIGPGPTASEGKWAGMSIGRRLATLFRVKANKALDRAEDPREVLDYSYEQQLEMVQKVRRGLADVATSRRRVELQVTQLQLSAGKLQDQAQQALAAGHEDLAREALIRRAAVTSQISDLQGQQASLQAEEDKLTLATQRLQARVDAFRTRKETVKAAYTAAEAQTQIGEAVTGISEEMGDIGMAMQRAQDKTEQMQARAAALDELMASGALQDATVPGGRDDVQSQLDALTAGHDVDDELARMKAQLPASAAPPAVEGPGTASADPPASPPEQQASS